MIKFTEQIYKFLTKRKYVQQGGEIMNRKELKLSAKQSLKGCSFNPYLLTIIYGIIIYVLTGIRYATQDSFVGAIVSIIVTLLTWGLGYGYSWWSLSVSRDSDNKDEFKAAFKKFASVFVASLVTGIIVVIGSIIIVIPGIIAALGLSMVPFCLKDNPEEGGFAAIKRSWAIMKGHKWEYLVLLLSFIPWMLLTGITFGLVGIYTMPYFNVTFAKFYESIKNEA